MCPFFESRTRTLIRARSELKWHVARSSYVVSTPEEEKERSQCPSHMQHLSPPLCVCYVCVCVYRCCLCLVFLLVLVSVCRSCSLRTCFDDRQRLCSPSQKFELLLLRPFDQRKLVWRWGSIDKLKKKRTLRLRDWQREESNNSTYVSCLLICDRYDAVTQCHNSQKSVNGALLFRDALFQHIHDRFIGFLTEATVNIFVALRCSLIPPLSSLFYASLPISSLPFRSISVTLLFSDPLFSSALFCSLCMASLYVSLTTTWPWIDASRKVIWFFVSVPVLSLKICWI